MKWKVGTYGAYRDDYQYCHTRFHVCLCNMVLQIEANLTWVIVKTCDLCGCGLGNGLSFEVEDLGFRVCCFGLGAWGLGFGVEGLGAWG